VNETVAFADARYLDGGDGWRWHLRQWRNGWFGKEHEDYSEDLSIVDRDDRLNRRMSLSMYSQSTGVTQRPSNRDSI
jgi:hypothetical protein